MASYASVVASIPTAGGNKTSFTSSGNEVEGVPYAIQRKAGPPLNIGAPPAPIQKPRAGAGVSAFAQSMGRTCGRQAPHLRAHSPLSPYRHSQTPPQSIGSPNFATIHGFNCNNSPTFATFNNTPTIPTGVGRNEANMYPYSPTHLGDTPQLPQWKPVVELSEPERKEARRESVNALIGLGIYMPSSPSTTTTTSIDTPTSPPLLPTRRQSPLRIETILDDDVPAPPRYVSSYPSRNVQEDVSVYSPGVPCMPQAPPASALPTPFVNRGVASPASPFTDLGDFIALNDDAYEAEQEDNDGFTFSPFSAPPSPMPTAAEFVLRFYPESSSSSTGTSSPSTSNPMTTSTSSTSSLESSSSITDDDLLFAESKAPIFDPDYTTKPDSTMRDLGLGLVGDAKFMVGEEDEVEFYLPSNLFSEDADEAFGVDPEYETGFFARVDHCCAKNDHSTIYETGTGASR